MHILRKNMRGGLSFLNVLFLALCLDCVVSKECTNTPTQSHTVRYAMMSSKNGTWRKEMHSHDHVTPTDESAWSKLLPRKMLKEEEDEFNWMMMYRKMKNSVKGTGDGNFLSEVSLNDVRLDPDSIHGQAQQTNLEYLLMLDVDSLAWSFRKTAGLDTPGKPYGGWEAPNGELRGHFVGHYLSASAQMWASTHNETLKAKMSELVSALSICQEKMGSGYLSAFPSEQFDRFEAIQEVWAPYYTIHKILAGLFDQHVLASNPQALKMMTWMVDYFYKRVQNVIAKHTIERHWLSLNEETGGMNDVLYKLFTITGDKKHLLLAHLFDKPCFLGLLAVKADHISGFHANTHIPIVVGSQMRYEVTGDPLYKEMGIFFMDIVNSSHSYATGGTSEGEFWSNPKRLATTLDTENEESCTTYNMLKVSRHLFRWTKEIAYADYYERALTNGVLSIQRGREPGIMIYMLPLLPGGSKAHTFHKWGSKFNDFWCCYGTGIESFSKLGDSIYFEEEGKVPGLYIIQYISSSLVWKSGNILLNMKVEPVVSTDPRLKVAITISTNQTFGLSTLHLRIPSWTNSDGAKANLNGQDLSVPAPGKFLTITKSWRSGDKINFEVPLSLTTEAIKDDRPEYASLQAILYGPYLLTGLSNGDWDIKSGTHSSTHEWITPVPADYNSQLFSLVQESGNTTFVLSHSDNTIKMEKFPEPGTDSAINATFRLVLENSTISKEVNEKQVKIEPFNFPGMFLARKDKEEEDLEIADITKANNSSVFRLVRGLNGKDDSVSLELGVMKGCFVYSGVDYEPGTRIKVRCTSDSSDATFNKAASFKMQQGISEYHPISFVAKGLKRNFLLMPLFSLRDESYTVYFNI